MQSIDTILYFFSYTNIIVLPLLFILLGVLAVALVVLCVKASRYLDAKTEHVANAPAPVAYAAPAAAPVAAAPVASAPAYDNSVGHVALSDVSDKDAALVMAIVANKLGTPVEKLRFTSIKRA